MMRGEGLWTPDEWQKMQPQQWQRGVFFFPLLTKYGGFFRKIIEVNERFSSWPTIFDGGPALIQAAQQRPRRRLYCLEGASEGRCDHFFRHLASVCHFGWLIFWIWYFEYFIWKKTPWIHQVHRVFNG